MYSGQQATVFDGVGIDWYTNGYDSETGTWNAAANVDEWLTTIFSENGAFAGDWYNSSFTRDWNSLFADYTTGFVYSIEFQLDPSAATALIVNELPRVDTSNPYNPTVTGTVQPAAGQQANVAALTVEFYLGGTLDGSTTTDGDGVFYYTLRTVQPGDNAVTVRIIEPQYGSETLRVTDVGTFNVPLEKNLNLHAATPTLMNGWVGGSDAWHAIDPTLVGTVTGFENPALRTVEFDYNDDGVAEAQALTDGLGRYSFVPVAIGEFLDANDDASVAVRAVDFQVDPTTGESYSVYGDWNSTAVTWHVEANDAPVITQFELAYDAVNRVESEEPNVETWQELDRITSDPTLVGRVMDSNAQAFVTVEFDHNGDGIVDGTTTTDENGLFRYVPVGLTAGLWDIRARVREFDPVKATLGETDEPQLDLGWARVTAQGVPFAYDASGDLIIDAEGKATDAASPFYGFTLVPTYSGSTTLQPLDHTASDYDPTLTGTVLDDDGLENTTVSFYYIDGDDQVSLGSTTPRADGTFEFTPLGLPFSDTTQTGEIRIYATAHEWNYFNAEEIALDEVFYDLHFIPYPNESNFAATTAAADSSIDPVFTGSVNVPSTVVSTGTASFTVDLINPLYVEVSVDGEFVTTVVSVPQSASSFWWRDSSS